ncbi:uncharacterized protein N7459_005805 [Penicillium hispanicum]|uniref:uncharacterized protein n=1 Tax=Penicillium hispanicum TaxID=1080232 RepID=UPI00254036A2|nr:uncharacterized protein N7459_005805 [Penicillium hispanicum]KAJ5579820.1 hypothetical protein N7459_005805 [Penicillium hispanicum]
MTVADQTSTDPDVAPNYQALLPEERLDPNYSWPLVVLADLSDDSKTKLVSFVRQMLEYDLRYNSKDEVKQGPEDQNGLHHISIQTWSPSEWLFKSIAKQGAHRDSQGNLHALAVLGHRSGRPRIIVADECTKQQLDGITQSPGRGDWVSVVLLSTRQKSTCSEGLSVFARRATCYPNERQRLMFEGWIQPYYRDDQPSAFMSADKYWHPLWEHYETNIGGREGFVLHDPDRAVFEADMPVTGREHYLSSVISSLKPYLPMELVTEILTLAENDTKRLEIPLWQRHPSRTHLVIFVFYQTTAEELERIRSVIQQAFSTFFPREMTVRVCDYENGGFYTRAEPWFPETPDMTVELIPWERHRLRSRRELMSFWAEYRLWDAKVEHYLWPSPLLFLLEPFSDIDSTKFSVVSCDGTWPKPTSISKLSLGSICRAVLSKGHVSLCQWDSLCFSANDYEAHNRYAETLWHPDQPFCNLVPRWQQGYGWIAAFSLTNSLTEEMIQHIREEVVADDGAQHDSDSEEDEYGFPKMYIGRRQCPFVPWKKGKAGETDGTVKDMWDILVEIYTYPGRAVDTFLCLDRQSAVDQTVIFVKADMGPRQDHPLGCVRGFTYTRIPAHSAQDTFRQSTRMRHFVGPHGWIRTYLRPGWPPHGTYPHEREAEGDYVDLEGNLVDLESLVSETKIGE